MSARALARRAYEIARLRRATTRAVGFAFVLGIVSLVLIGPSVLPWLAVFVAIWTALEWRGTGVLRGGRVGGLVGIALALTPPSLFMSCCRVGCTMAAGVCCNTSRACAVIGGLVGLAVTAFLARLPRQERVQATVGAALGLVATAMPRCAALLMGEAFGLLMGLIAGTLAAGIVCALMDRIRQPA